ncbi:MAG: long-chain fatty acid--CoA ligase [Gammaproteobacteria bacterium]|nr:long-chain fatty acid--CoA ligase [Gammaproteobacteria bacterium]
MSQDVISPDIAATIPALFRERLKRNPDKIAYQQYNLANKSWESSSWGDISVEIIRWQASLAKEKLQPGERVALMLKNSRDWVVFDQAALGMGLVTVPLYVDDRPDNVAYILNDANVKVLLVEDTKQWQRLLDLKTELPDLQRIISIEPVHEEDQPSDARLVSRADWLFGAKGELQAREREAEELASIVYTSGTTGRPKGVMLSHKNIISDAYGAFLSGEEHPSGYFLGTDQYLSFLPLSHMFERTVGYMLPMMVGAQVNFARSIPQLGEDLQNIKPTILVSVPRIFERVYSKIMDGLKSKSPIARKLFDLTVTIGWMRFQYQQKRKRWSPLLLLWPVLNKLVASKVMEKLGGRMRIAICGGAALSPEVARLFIGLGLPLVQGYGLTEASPVISSNRVFKNIPHSIGYVFPNVQVRIGVDDELQSYGDNNMLGYWNNQEATDATFTEDGWLRSGDKARIDENGFIYITGRLKDILVLANGEKVPPADMEMAISVDGLFEQVMVIGEARPYLTACVVLNPEHWEDLADKIGFDAEDKQSLEKKEIEKLVLSRISRRLKDFPGYAQIRRVAMFIEPWTIDDGLITPTLKIKRKKVLERFADKISRLYAGHGVK